MNVYQLTFSSCPIKMYQQSNLYPCHIEDKKDFHCYIADLSHEMITILELVSKMFCLVFLLPSWKWCKRKSFFSCCLGSRVVLSSTYLGNRRNPMSHGVGIYAGKDVKRTEPLQDCSWGVRMSPSLSRLTVQFPPMSLPFHPSSGLWVYMCKPASFTLGNNL